MTEQSSNRQALVIVDEWLVTLRAPLHLSADGAARARSLVAAVLTQAVAGLTAEPCLLDLGLSVDLTQSEGSSPVTS